MNKSFEQAAQERKDYIRQIRASFETNYPVSPSPVKTYDAVAEIPEEKTTSSTLGIRTTIAIFIFAVFVYCDKENVTYQNYTTEEVFSQIEWNPLPTEDIEKYVQSP